MNILDELNIEHYISENDFATDKLGKGTYFYRHLNELGNQFWLFTFFHKASKSDLSNAKEQLLLKADVRSSPALDELFDLLEKQNGFQLYSNSLIVYGVTNNVDYLYLSEPNSIVKNNLILPKNVSNSWITLGYYSINSSKNAMIFIDAKLNIKNCFSSVVTNESTIIIKKWDSIEEMLKNCIAQLKTHYNIFGYKIDADPNKPVIIKNKTYIL